VIDIRNFGLMGAIELAPREGTPGARGLEIHIESFKQGLMVRNGMDILQFAPFLTATPEYFEQVFDILRRVMNKID
ncbi:MAG: aspartate aminotransferase family protein, partial [Pseudomonadales bacterium]|nr:aspartate aminotransferase family protein [Pseudomonadales bacterium]